MRALVLAGQRPGGDPLARTLGIAHKAHIPVGGTPMLSRVVAALEASAGIDAVSVITETPDAMSGLCEADWRTAAATPSLSVMAALEGLTTPMLVTTADHALLTPQIVETFLAQAPADADIAVALVARKVIEARFPQARRTYLRFRDDGYSGANLFLLRNANAMRAVAFWRRVESNRKKPWQIAWAFGPRLLLAYTLGRLTMAQGIARAGQAMRVRAAGVALPFAEAAVDVDKLADLELAETILRERGG